MFLYYFISADLVKINIVSRDEKNLPRDFDYIVLFKSFDNPAKIDWIVSIL